MIPQDGHFWSNPNLLDNWYFGDPVNQRCVTEFTGGYGIDRWYAVDGATATLEADGIKVQSHQRNGSLVQCVNEKASTMIKGKTVTCSWLLTTGLYSQTYQIPATGHFDLTECWVNSSWYLDMFTEIDGGKTFFRIINNTEDDSTVTAIAAKLEFGDKQTLAHKEGGNWVLNETPNYSEQLVECQRYYQVYGPGLYASVQGRKLTFSIPFYIEMRATPTIILLNSTIHAHNMNQKTGFNIANATLDLNGATSKGATHIIIDGQYDVIPNDGDVIRMTSADFYIALSADL